MKVKVILQILLLTLIALPIRAQYSSENSFLRKALVFYEKGRNGFYQCYENRMIEFVDNVVSVYGYDKKTHNLYVSTNNGNYVITLNNDYAKIVKKNSQIPKISDSEAESLIRQINNELKNIFDSKNDSIRAYLVQVRQKEIEDSIKEEKRIAEEKEQKRKEKLAQQERLLKYRERNYSAIIPIVGFDFDCSECDKTYSKSFMLAHGIKNDSIYYFSYVTKELGDRYTVMHISPIPSVIKTNPLFMYHIHAFKDSLCTNSTWNSELVELYNDDQELEHYDRIRKKCPYGYFEDWTWNNEYSVTFNFEYVNLYHKTIKYIDVYWKITNDVGDIRKTGHFKGTGPLEQYHSASWSWDSSPYYVAGDASKMQLTKVVLTYMDGSQKTIGKSQIETNHSAEYEDDMEKSFHSDYVSSYKTNENYAVDTPAMYKNGALALYDDIHSNLAYEKNNSDFKRGFVLLKLEIGTDGKIGEIKVNKSLNKKYDDAAIAAAKQLGDFIPASHKGEKVKVWFKLPVDFYFDN